MNKFIKKVIAKIRYPFNANERQYFLNDPWHMERPSEQYRFKEVNRIIEENKWPISSIVEVGSATGDQTKWLLQLPGVKKVHGIELSKQAVKRARKNLNNETVSHNGLKWHRATFEVGSLPNLPYKAGQIHCDLITAFEIFTYIPVSEIPAAIEALTNAASYRMVSYHQSKVPSKVQGKLDPFFFSIPGVQSTEIEFEGEKWTVLWW